MSGEIAQAVAAEISVPEEGQAGEAAATSEGGSKPA